MFEKFTKFSDIEYVRPDMKAAEACVYGFIEKLAKAKSYAEARKLYIEYDKSTDGVSAMYTVASIRNTMDTRDEFYDGEMNFFYEEMPKFRLVAKKADEALISSPYKADFEKDFGADLIKGIEASIKLADERVIEEQIEESKLSQEYSKLTAACSVEFMGESCNFYGLLKHMQSADRAERKAAFEAWAKLYESVSDKLDGIYLRLCDIRRTMAQKLGFKNYIQMAYLANGHYYYGAEEVASFRKQVVDEVVPAVSRLYKEQKNRLGIDKLRYYDEQVVFP